MLIPYKFPDPVARKFHRYPDGWNLFSFWIKQWAHWTCSDCGWRPQKKVEKSDIIVHHKSGDTYWNESENLVVLCCDCHDLRHGRKVALRRRTVVAQRRKWVEKRSRRRRRRYDESGWPLPE